jgi:Flp pilus assembly protein TadD
MRWSLLALLVLAVACAAPGPSLQRSRDPERYRVLQDAQAAESWQSAQRAVAAGALPDAVALLQQTLARCPEFVPAHLAFQDAATQLGGESESGMRDYYRNLPEVDSPVPAYCRSRLLETAYERDQVLKALLARAPSFAYAHLARGRIQDAKGQLQAAVDSYHAATYSDPGLAEARLLRAAALVELGRNEEAAIEYEIYLGMQPADDAVRHAYAQLLVYRLRRIARGQQLLDELAQRRPADLAVLMDRAAATWLAGDAKESLRRYLAVLAAEPQSPRALLNIGLLYYDALPRNDNDRLLYWPRARLAFELFLASTASGVAGNGDGHEEFERNLAVPFRLAVIAEQMAGSVPLAADWQLLALTER